MVQFSTTYFILMAAVVAAVVVAAAAAATDSDPDNDDVDSDPTDPTVTDNPRCKHPLFCRQRPPTFGARLRPLMSTTTPSTTTTRRSTNRFGARPNLYSSENLPQVNNDLQSDSKSRFPQRTASSGTTEEPKDPQTADIEDLKATEERTTIKRTRLRVTTKAPPERSNRIQSSSSRPGSSEQTTTTVPLASTTRRRLPVTMARYRTATAKSVPKTTVAAPLDLEEEEKTTTAPSTLPPVAECPDGVCTTIKRLPGSTVVIRRKKIRPTVNSDQSRFQVTTEPTSFTEQTIPDFPKEDTSTSQKPQEGFVTRRPLTSNRAQGRFKGRLRQRIRENSITTTEKANTDTFHEVSTNPVNVDAVRKQNLDRFKSRKKVTTTPEPFANTEFPTTQPWREDLNEPEDSFTKNGRLNPKCGKSCKNNVRRPTTTPEPENYPPTFVPLIPLKPLKQQATVAQFEGGDEEDVVRFSHTIRPNTEYKTETGNQNNLQENPSNKLPLSLEEAITKQYLKEVTPTTESQINAGTKTGPVAVKNIVKSENSLPIQTKTRTGKVRGEVGAVVSGIDDFNHAQSPIEFPNSHRPQTSPNVKHANQVEMPKPNDFSGYNYAKPQTTTKKPSQQTPMKRPSYETGKNFGGYSYAKPATSFAPPTTARPRPQTTPTLGLNSYMYPKPQMSYFYPTTIKPTMQESTSFLPMLLQKKQEVLENTPIIGPAMTTVRNIINFITQNSDPQKSNRLVYQPPYQYPTTFNPMVPQTTYPPYMNFPPYPPRNAFHKQSPAVENGFKLKAKPRKNQKGFNENRTTGFDAHTTRPVSSPRPYKKHTNEPFLFESTKIPSSQYDTASKSSLKPEASSHYHHYRSPSKGKHVSRGHSSGRKTRTRSSRKRCQHMRCRSPRQNSIRSQDVSIYVPVSSMLSVREPKLRTKRQDSESKGYDYPRPTAPPEISLTDSPATTELFVPSTEAASIPSGSVTLSSSSTVSSLSSGGSNSPGEDFEGYDYPKPAQSNGPTLTAPGRPAPTMSSGSTSSSSPGGSNNSGEDFEGYDYPKPAQPGNPTSIAPGSPTPTPPRMPAPTPTSAAQGSANQPEEEFSGYDYSKPAQPFPPVSGGATLPKTENEGYDYPKPSK